VLCWHYVLSFSKIRKKYRLGKRRLDLFSIFGWSTKRIIQCRERREGGGRDEEGGKLD
jgi:hypothetical protein